MKLSGLLERFRDAGGSREIRRAGAADDPEISAVVYDSRRVRGEGVLFACFRGDHADGHDFAAKAFASGAVALLCERPLPVDLPQIVTPGVRGAMSALSAVLYDRPADRMGMIGVTGTNGKTTTAYILRAILRAVGERVGMLGTIVYDDGCGEVPADRTTPEGPDIQAFLAKMAANGVSWCVMEASSHGLDQGRLEGCAFDAVGFSNLTPEHLEYHADMEGYFRAKRLLFTKYAKAEAVGAANADDAYGMRLLEDFANLRAFSLERGAECPRAYRAERLRVSLRGTSFDALCPDGGVLALETPLIGRHNAANVLEAVTIADALGLDRLGIAKGVAGTPQVPGRLERYAFSNDVHAFVDYAHSPDGVEQVLRLLSGLKSGKLVSLWGAGGDRSPSKRPVVGGILAKYSDYAVISTDNPRSERPEAIAAAVEEGFRAAGGSGATILDRKEAIMHALDRAAPGDIVLIAGKGPERFIEYADRKVPFCDAEAVEEWARSRGHEVIGR